MVSNEKWFGASADFYSETIDQSLRFDGGGDLRNSSFSTPTNNQNWTWSAWVKLAVIDSGLRVLFQADTNSVDALQTNNNNLTLTVAGTSGTTTAKYRDTSNWYHVVFNYNGSNSYLYINNRLDLTLSPSGNSKFNNSSYTHFLGQNGSNGRYWSGYMAEVNFIDGQALDPSNFGETKNGVWIPKNVSGLTYGNNGFRLTFANSSALGDDTSTNTNDFTVAGTLASTDVVLDSPTNNYCTWNRSNDIGVGNLTEGATKWAVTGSHTNEGVDSTFAMPTSGKWYWEYHAQDKGYLSHIGLTSAGTNLNNTGENKGTRASWSFGTWHATYNGNNSKYTSIAGGSTGSNWSGAGNVTDGQVLGCAYDADNGTLWFSRAGVFIDTSGTANPATNTDPRFSGLNDGTQWFAYNSQYASGSPDFFVNFGQDSSFAGSKTSGSSNAQDDNGQGDFYYAPPSGFLALCSANLPDTTISPNQATQADDHFNTVLWTGTGNTTQNITGVGFQPDWVWIKNRNTAVNHYILDSSRGLNYLSSSLTSSESSSANRFNSFDSDGFQVEHSGGGNGFTNGSGQTYVAWNWKAGGTTPTKTYKVVVVSDSGNKFRFRNSSDSATFPQSGVTLNLQELGTYTFDVSDSSMSGHALKFSTTSDGIHGGGSEYTTGVTSSGTSGQSGAYVQITVASSAPTLYYYCGISGHSGMGGQINTNTTHGSTNFDGSILSVAQTNETAGFSILTYTGNATAGATYGHGLGTAPDIVITKKRSASGKWFFFTTAEPTKYNYLNQNTSAFTTGNFDDRFGNDTSVILPSSTVVTIGTNVDVNTSGATYVSYCFTEVEGYSKFGSYTGNSSTDGTFVYTGFRPAFVLGKSSSSAGDNWYIFDNKRDVDNVVGADLNPDSSAAETTSTYMDFLSNGFKFRSSSGLVNDATTFIYMAFAEQPFKFSNAR